MAITAPFAVQPVLTQIAMAVRVDGMIADYLSPRIQVAGEQFIYSQLGVDQFFTVPDTTVGRLGQPNQVEFSGVDTPSMTLERVKKATARPDCYAFLTRSEGHPLSSSSRPLSQRTRDIRSLVCPQKRWRACVLPMDKPRLRQLVSEVARTHTFCSGGSKRNDNGLTAFWLNRRCWAS